MEKANVFSEIKKEMIRNRSWRDVAVWKCFSDHIVTYHIENDELLTELNIISSDVFYPVENPIELFRKKGISYLEHSIFIKNGSNWEKIGSKTYNAIE